MGTNTMPQEIAWYYQVELVQAVQVAYYGQGKGGEYEETEDHSIRQSKLRSRTRADRSKDQGKRTMA